MSTVDIKAGSNEIVLDVTIGNGQVGGSVVRDDVTDELIIKGVTNLTIGTKSGLKGRTIRVITNVSDVNPATNKMVVTHTFSVTDPGHFRYQETVDNDGDILSLITKYHFI